MTEAQCAILVRTLAVISGQLALLVDAHPLLTEDEKTRAFDTYVKFSNNVNAYVKDVVGA